MDASIDGRFKPTVGRPLAAQQCTGIVKNGPREGERCRKRCVGATVCRSHGGQLPIVRQAAAARIEAARLRLMNASERCVEVLEELVESAPAAVRVRAAAEVLSRAGIQAGVDLTLRAPEPSPGDLLRERLGRLRIRSAEADGALVDAPRALPRD